MVDGQKSIKWATKKYLEDEKRSMWYNKLAKILIEDEILMEERINISATKHSLVEVINSANLSKWCTDIRHTIKVGVWCSGQEYTPRKKTWWSL